MKINSGLLLVMLSVPWSVMGLSTDSSQPIHIEADSVEIDDVKGISIYQGNVRYTQGSIRMTAEVMTVYTHQGQLDKFSATGALAHYQQTLDGEDGEINAEAMMIDYFADKEQLLLQGKALLTRSDNRFSGNIIEYDAKANLVNARKGETTGERVEVIIQPRQSPVDQGSTGSGQ